MAGKDAQRAPPKDDQRRKRSALGVIPSILIIFIVSLLAYIFYDSFFGGTSGEICTYGGKDYGIDESFTAIDGCNTCTCQGNDVVTCTLMACPDEVTSPKEGWCRYDGIEVALGDSFMAADGCNTCTCEKGGLITCTEEKCGE